MSWIFYLTNSSSIDEILNNLNLFITETLLAFRDSKNKGNWLSFESVPELLQFSEIQYKLLKGFLLLLVVNLLFIFIAWWVYGKRICDRFMKPATSKAIEELKASVSKLKLPKEHTPRI